MISEGPTSTSRKIHQGSRPLFPVTVLPNKTTTHCRTSLTELTMRQKQAETCVSAERSLLLLENLCLLTFHTHLSPSHDNTPYFKNGFIPSRPALSPWSRRCASGMDSRVCDKHADPKQHSFRAFQLHDSLMAPQNPIKNAFGSWLIITQKAAALCYCPSTFPFLLNASIRPETLPSIKSIRHAFRLFHPFVPLTEDWN